MVDVEGLIVPPESTIRDVMVCIDRNAKGIALVVGPDPVDVVRGTD